MAKIAIPFRKKGEAPKKSTFTRGELEDILQLTLHRMADEQKIQIPEQLTREDVYRVVRELGIYNTDVSTALDHYVRGEFTDGEKRLLRLEEKVGGAVALLQESAFKKYEKKALDVLWNACTWTKDAVVDFGGKILYVAGVGAMISVIVGGVFGIAYGIYTLTPRYAINQMRKIASDGIAEDEKENFTSHLGSVIRWYNGVDEKEGAGYAAEQFMDEVAVLGVEPYEGAQVLGTIINKSCNMDPYNIVCKKGPYRLKDEAMRYLTFMVHERITFVDGKSYLIRATEKERMNKENAKNEACYCFDELVTAAKIVHRTEPFKLPMAGKE